MIHGETPGKVFELSRENTLIGRDVGCNIILSQKFVSRRHSMIIRGADGVAIEDLGSHCGTVVEGQRIVTRVALKDGYNIKIGNYLFIFSLPSVQINENEDPSSTIIGVLDVARPEDVSGSPVNAREKLRHVLEISSKLGESLRLEDVLDKTLECLFKIFPQADRGFVLLSRGGAIDYTPRAIRFRERETGNLTISRTILNHVLNGGKAILSSDAASDRRFESSHSIVGAIRMMMCVPLLDVERKLRGILQIDTSDDRGRFTQEDLDLLVAVASQVSVAVDNAQLHTTSIEQTQIEQEAVDANEVQLALLPERRPSLPGYDFWDYYEPARFVGGDYFDYLPVVSPDAQGNVASRRWWLAVGDVAGKGMPAALLMARLSAEVRLIALTMTDPLRIVERLNRDFCHRSLGERYITFLLVLVDTESHRITAVSAGHPGPIIRRGDDSLEILGEGDRLRKADDLARPLGVTHDSVYTASSASLEPGDLVVLYTDGLIEALDVTEHDFGLARLMQTLQSVPRGVATAGREIIRAVRQHSAGCPQSDDITLLCFQRLGSPS
jgi:serine phosphatase RsbU (regulator of sigma subunit)/pSer/pThr/pTyr-binding forkhead associated (FHA) protein